MFCDVVDESVPKIEWYKDEKSIANSEKFLMDHLALFVRNPTRNESGVYKCGGSNPQGFVTKSFNVRILTEKNTNRSMWMWIVGGVAMVLILTLFCTLYFFLQAQKV